MKNVKNPVRIKTDSAECKISTLPRICETRICINYYFSNKMMPAFQYRPYLFSEKTKTGTATTKATTNMNSIYT
jgi:hypothetical protein